VLSEGLHSWYTLRRYSPPWTTHTPPVAPSVGGPSRKANTVTRRAPGRSRPLLLPPPGTRRPYPSYTTTRSHIPHGTWIPPGWETQPNVAISATIQRRPTKPRAMDRATTSLSVSLDKLASTPNRHFQQDGTDTKPQLLT
jgi:hypothetical protein